MTMQEALDSQDFDEPAKPPVCSTCNDTHMMPFRGEEAMCTRCPVPCQKCRAGGNGVYCTTTPCGCAGHGARVANVEPPGLGLEAIRRRVAAWAGAEPVEDFEAARDRAALLDEVSRLTRERDAAYLEGLQKGFNIAEESAWISTWDGWHVTNPRIDWEAARKALEKAKAEVKP